MIYFKIVSLFASEYHKWFPLRQTHGDYFVHYYYHYQFYMLEGNENKAASSNTWFPILAIQMPSKNKQTKKIGR